MHSGGFGIPPVADLVGVCVYVCCGNCALVCGVWVGGERSTRASRFFDRSGDGNPIPIKPGHVDIRFLGSLFFYLFFLLFSSELLAREYDDYASYRI